MEREGAARETCGCNDSCFFPPLTRGEECIVLLARGEKRKDRGEERGRNERKGEEKGRNEERNGRGEGKGRKSGKERVNN